MNTVTTERRRKRVLVVDDEADIRELLDLTLARMGIEADCAGTIAEARSLLKSRRYRLCLTDMRLPDGEGLDLVRHIGETCAQLPVAVITAHGSMENAVSVLKAGAFDYLTNPVALDQLRALVKSALELPQSLHEGATAPGMTLLGQSQAIVEVRVMIERVARSQAPLHIGGESGSGKELAARLIHTMSSRQSGPFVPVNCGAIPENLMESEFFGYRKGAFTGADDDRDGFFQTANGGTLFLDEVADLPLSMQVKLLRAIQEKRVRKVGSPNEEPVDVRIISATHKRLKGLVDAGNFRQDLFYRLNVIEVQMPALRDCREDIGLLSAAILEKLARTSGMDTPELSSSALRALSDYSFPGNVRELENILERAIALLQGETIQAADLRLPPSMIEEDAETDTGNVIEAADIENESASSLQSYLDGVEKKTILEALQKTRFNRTAAAKLLGVTFRSLRYRMERLGLNE
jgi:two-component system, NtrC family, response regulator PilR